MGILDDFGTDPDDFDPDKKKTDPFRIDTADMAKQPASYGTALGNAFAASAGGDGGALPSFSVTDDTYTPTKAAPVAAVAEPLKMGQGAGMEAVPGMQTAKPAAGTAATAKIGMPAIKIPEVKPAANPVATAGINAAPASVDNHADTGFDKVLGYLNRTAQPEQIESENAVALGREIADERQTDPQTVQAVAPKNDGQTANVSNPDLFLARVKSERSRNDSANALYSLFNATSEEAHAMADVRNASFNPATINQYSNWEKAHARDTVSTALNNREAIRFDPDMAKKQAYPIFDRNYQTASFDSDALSGILEGTFSGKELKGQVRDHMLSGSQISYKQAKQVADGMAALDKTVYGKTVKNLVASIGMGQVNFSRDMVHTAAQVLSAAPPPEIAMFHYQQMYNANIHDLSGWAKEVENMNSFAVNAGNNVSGALGETAHMLRSQRSDDYNNLKYLTLDPAQSALLRGDKIVGDIFEKFVPAVASMAIPGKGVQAANMGFWAQNFLKLGWAAKMGFNSGASARMEAIRRDPSMVERNPEWHKYKRESFLPEAQARERFIELDSWQSGVWSGMLSIGTYVGSTGFRHVTTTGVENPLLQWTQRFILGEAKHMSREAVGIEMPDYDQTEKGGAKIRNR
ncbi:hypothetical protein NB640_01450 [Oxalobacter vibrioformis]|uniref:Uncharacterized protein n=1 Tax=Oxalobacter vibrioformis TaxID=933080 RepID=A0A9E9LZF6_9BURK|nr:hypothetical protein [Oxalobacter vibrioformis]WAW10359.1 hypothetical protein NB640_01450 [Oxalobacter vibrioformis]